MSTVETKAGQSARDLSVDWPQALYETLKRAGIGHMAYVPDAGHSTLINLFSADVDVKTNVLTTEEEGIAIASGAWLGGMRSVVLMQSSGVGNCINMLSLPTQSIFNRSIKPTWNRLHSTTPDIPSLPAYQPPYLAPHRSASASGFSSWASNGKLISMARS